MLSSLPTLLARMESKDLRKCEVIPWGCPVPVFGEIERAKIATLGINPSNLEFVDDDGNELFGEARRFHTLRSLGLPSWGIVDATHIRILIESFYQYFNRNPYSGWFSRLETVLNASDASYYRHQQSTLAFASHTTMACHLDLVPYATSTKWNELTPRQQRTLLSFGGNCLGQLLRDSEIQFIICNGRSVVFELRDLAEIKLSCFELTGGELPRRSLPPVKGFGFKGVLTEICGVDIGREITVLGYNHNLQSSFGVTNKAIAGVSNWITEQLRDN